MTMPQPQTVLVPSRTEIRVRDLRSQLAGRHDAAAVAALASVAALGPGMAVSVRTELLTDPSSASAAATSAEPAAAPAGSIHEIAAEVTDDAAYDDR